ncbi:MbtH family protein [Amycolatopsis sp. WQ 127309]|uniref:MbtH family protein n=1 Tax=Amycolatopsis sp. WQ 127309 TaxID=2932773 RepID=UPI001FF57150|nr:MbtH family protein [Amycolatopsis sp. WQ 127309]UOZ05564.1 MbtH family protein [Amycolatopsis sp. WQ 127309]
MHDNRQFAVVVDDHDRYSVWPADAEPPTGWRATGPTGTRPECLEHIDRVWTGLHPGSLRAASGTSR